MISIPMQITYNNWTSVDLAPLDILALNYKQDTPNNIRKQIAKAFENQVNMGTLIDPIPADLSGTD